MYIFGDENDKIIFLCNVLDFSEIVNIDKSRLKI